MAFEIRWEVEEDPQVAKRDLVAAYFHEECHHSRTDGKLATVKFLKCLDARCSIG